MPVLMKDIENELIDLGYELGEIDSTLLTNACYIGKRMFGIDLPDDFEPYGKPFVMSDFLSRNIHSLELRALAGFITERPPEGYSSKDSTLGKLGSLPKNYKEDDMRLAAVYLLRGHIPNNFSDEEIEKAKRIIKDISEKGSEYF